jgi:hypothetical protein
MFAAISCGEDCCPACFANELTKARQDSVDDSQSIRRQFDCYPVTDCRQCCSVLGEVFHPSRRLSFDAPVLELNSKDSPALEGHATGLKACKRVVFEA